MIDGRRHEQDPPDAPTTEDDAETHHQRLDRFVREHRTTLVRVAVKFVHFQHVADDVVQNSLVKILRQLDRHPNHELTIEWATKITINCALDHWRTAARWGSVVTELGISGTSHNAADRITHQTVQATLARLPLKVAQAFLLHRVAGFTSREVGALLHLSESTVRGMTAKAARALREAIEDGDGRPEERCHGPR